LQERGSLTPWVTPEALATWHAPPAGKRGRARRYSDLAIETGQMLRLAFHRPWRQTEGLLRSIASRLGVSLEVPDHTTFSRRSIGLPLATAPPSTAGPVGVVIDSTGLKIYGAGEWQREKHGQRGRRTWRKLHWAIHPDNGEILASELTTNEPGDRSMVGPLLDQIPGSPTLLKGTGGCPFLFRRDTKRHRSHSKVRGNSLPRTFQADLGGKVGPGGLEPSREFVVKPKKRTPGEKWLTLPTDFRVLPCRNFAFRYLKAHNGSPHPRQYSWSASATDSKQSLHSTSSHSRGECGLSAIHKPDRVKCAIS
jgi:hypothetical protein